MNAGWLAVAIMWNRNISGEDGEEEEDEGKVPAISTSFPCVLTHEQQSRRRKKRKGSVVAIVVDERVHERKGCHG